jgi:hypothetical protein
LKYLRQNFIFAFEVVIDQRFGNAGGFGDLVNAGGVEALLSEEASAVARIFSLLFSLDNRVISIFFLFN